MPASAASNIETTSTEITPTVATTQLIQQDYELTLSETEKQWLKDHPRIRLGIDKNWAPYDFLDSSGQFQGISADIVRLIEQRLAITLDITQQKQWSETYQKAKTHEIDIVSGVAKNNERINHFNFTTAYFSTEIVIYNRKESDVINGIQDLSNKTIVTEQQYFLHQLLRDEYPDIKLLLVETTEEALTALSYGKADAYIGNQGSSNWIIEKKALTNLQITPAKTLGNMPLHFSIRKDWPVLQAIFNKALASISDTELSLIRRKWLSVDESAHGIVISNQERKWLDDNKLIRFTGDPNWLPYEAFDEQGNYIGIVSEYLKLIEKKLNIKLTIIPTESWTESIDKIEQDEVDILSETANSNLTEKLLFTQSYLTSPVVIIMRDNEDYVDNIDQIKNRTIAIIKNYGYAPEIIQENPSTVFTNADSIQEGLTAVSTGEIDALFATLAQASYHISEMGINNIRIVGKTEANTSLAFGIRPELAPLVPLFNRAISNITQSEKQLILNRWGKQQYPVKTDRTLLIQIIIIFLLIISIIAYWNRKLGKEIIYRKEIENQSKALIEHIPLQIILTSPNGNILSANPKALADYNIEKKDIGQHKMLDFYTDKNDSKLVHRELSTKGFIDQKIIPFNNPDGTSHAMMVSIIPITYHKKPALLSIAVDMTERLEFENALKKSTELAEKANAEKSQFLANMSHEIRTPMNAILGYTQLLNDQIQDKKLQSFTQTIQKAGNNLLTLINDILDLSKIEAGKFQIKLMPCDPHELFTEIGNIFMIEMQTNNLDFILDIDEDIPKSLLLDYSRLRQVLFNLIGNAVKFTEQGFIKVSARTTNEDKTLSSIDLFIDVEDSGIGISEEEHNKIFDKFEQSEGQDIHQYGGTGLGLSISKRLIDMMGGSLSVTSTRGSGSIFTIALQNIHISTVAAEQTTSTLADHASVKFHPAKILIVDDIEDNRKLLREYFHDKKFSITEACNGKEAVELEKKHSFDIILMDIRMPIMNGYESAETIKKNSDVPIIALTASVMTDQFEQMKSENFDGYLRKPILRNSLVKELKKFLPFETTTLADDATMDMDISTTDLTMLPIALSKLGLLMENFSDIKKVNNLDTIENFSEAMAAIVNQHPVKALSDYQLRLKFLTTCFDIAEIKKHLNNYETLIKQLEAITDQNKS